MAAVFLIPPKNWSTCFYFCAMLAYFGAFCLGGERSDYRVVECPAGVSSSRFWKLTVFFWGILEEFTTDGKTLEETKVTF